MRGDVLARAADLLEQRSQLLMGLIVREAGKTLPNAVAEIREAVDFLRYYGAMVADQFDNARERPLGVVLAISPWNFPLAIFAGQVAAALAAGNAVLAKPAEQTPLTAAAMVAILYEAGVPRDALQFVPGQGKPWAQPWWRTRRWPGDVHRLHRGGQHHCQATGPAPVAQRPADSADCRNRRAKRHDRRSRPPWPNRWWAMC